MEQAITEFLDQVIPSFGDMIVNKAMAFRNLLERMMEIRRSGGGGYVPPGGGGGYVPPGGGGGYVPPGGDGGGVPPAPIDPLDPEAGALSRQRAGRPSPSSQRQPSRPLPANTPRSNQQRGLEREGSG